ncbi:Small G protein signaling modulator 2, partial [Dermatophagoides pteronyssinus]
SGSITSLCAAVDACLSHGLKRRALGLFKTNSTTALLQKVAKNFDIAALVLKKVQEIENIDPNKRSSSSSDISIVDHVVKNSSKYYERDALVSDPVAGQIFASLLVGPCALDYTKIKTQDQYWTDPPADELVQRHRISSSVCLPNPIDDQEPMPGYLSLHQDSNGLSIKWTPNQLINGRVNQPSSDGNNDGFFNHSMDKTSAFWNYALNVNVENIVYLHCHQHKLSYSSIVMVGRDGVMHPPIKFPKGGHLLAFLSCLENGLVPYGQLDPPLWSENGKGKIFPKLRRKSGHHHNGEQRNDQQQSLDMESDDITADYVFRVISINDKPDTISAELFEPKLTQKQSEFLPKSNDENQPQQQQQQQKPEASPSCQQIEIAVNETKTEIEQQQQFR